MNEVKNVGFPIETERDGNRITKTCVEDIYKMISRVREVVNKSYTNISFLIRSTQCDYKGVNGKFIIGKGTSQPCILDAFDEEIGNNIAFMKAKLNANIKKYRILKQMYREVAKMEDSIFNEMYRIEEYIDLDLNGLRKHNPDYLVGKEKWW